jgi:hypothetical protein
MSNLTRRAGTRCLRWFVLSAAVTVLAVQAAGAQESPNNDDRNMLDRFRAGTESAERAQAACDKFARWFAARLNDPKTREPTDNQGESLVVKDLSNRLGLLLPNSAQGNKDYARHAKERQPFVEEFGKSLVTALTGPATQNANYIVRINAMRMIAAVCQAGYDGAAELCLTVLAKPDENDAVKLYALQGIKNLFFILPEPSIPEKTIFQKQNNGALTKLEQKTIQALIDYIFRQPADLKPEQVDGMLYVRREAVRALALVRVQRVGEQSKYICSPALALLKIARGDGLSPPSVTPNGPDIRALGERLEAIIGFCSLYQARDNRDMNIDYAAYHIGRAIQELCPLYKFNVRDTSTPWKVQAQWMRDALTRWKTMSGEMALQDAKLVSELLDIVDRDILKLIEEADAASLPNPANLDQWLKANKPKSTSLFKNDPKSTVNVP